MHFVGVDVSSMFSLNLLKVEKYLKNFFICLISMYFECTINEYDLYLDAITKM
jgi:hypothetical protein